MDYSKKHEISVYLTEEQLNQRIAEIGAQITERFKGESVYLAPCDFTENMLYPERIYLFHNRTCKADCAANDDRFYISIQLWSTDPFFRCRKYQEGSGTVD